MYDEWYARYIEIKDKPLTEAELIVSDESRYNKISYSPDTNPTGAMKAHKTRTFGDLTDDMTDINKNVYKIVEYFDAKYAK